MANKDIEKKMKEAQEAMLNKSKPPKKEKKSKRKPIKEVYTEIKESLKPQVKENIDEKALIQELFKGETTVEEILNIEPEEPTRHRDGLWDYVIEDEIEYFDPECSYELTGYKPITATKGLDFDPTPFREAGIIYETTGAYTQYPKDSKPYVDFWEEQKRRCREGYEVNGYRIPGDLYFFLNFYRLPVTKEKDGILFVEESFPVFTTEHYKWFHYVEICERVGKDVCALKPRGVEYCAPI